MVDISIIIPTYHRKESLLRLLRSIEKQSAKHIEVIVVEQGDRNEVEYRTVCRTAEIPFTYLFQKTISTSRAKNAGANHAKGRYLLFYDDDVVLKPKAISQIIRNFQDNRIMGVCGRVLSPDKPPETGYKKTGRISLLGVFSDGFSSDIPQEIDTVIGCHAAWRRTTFEEVDGFDERFTGNAMREESDLSLRIRNLGYVIVFDPKAEVVHLREPHGGARKIDDRLSWYFHYFSNETYFYLKHRPYVLLPVFLSTRISFILRCMFGFGREVSVRSISVPILGISDGIRKYYDYRR